MNPAGQRTFVMDVMFPGAREMDCASPLEAAKRDNTVITCDVSTRTLGHRQTPGTPGNLAPGSNHVRGQVSTETEQRQTDQEASGLLFGLSTAVSARSAPGYAA